MINNLTKMEYFLDYCHLKSSLVLPYVYKELSFLKILNSSLTVLYFNDFKLILV